MTDYQRGYEAALHEVQNVLSMIYRETNEKHRLAGIAEKSYYMGAMSAFTGAFNGISVLLQSVGQIESPRRPSEPSIN